MSWFKKKEKGKDVVEDKKKNKKKKKDEIKPDFNTKSMSNMELLEQAIFEDD